MRRPGKRRMTRFETGFFDVDVVAVRFEAWLWVVVVVLIILLVEVGEDLREHASCIIASFL
jgi:hypothetical protein